jgi:hypothetical protein
MGRDKGSFTFTVGKLGELVYPEVVIWANCPISRRWNGGTWSMFHPDHRKFQGEEQIGVLYTVVMVIMCDNTLKTVASSVQRTCRATKRD